MFDYSTFDVDTFDAAAIFITPVPPALPIDQVFALDSAYGSATVTRVTMVRSASKIYAGKTSNVLLAAGVALDPNFPVVFVFTKPDKTTFSIVGSIGTIQIPTEIGEFEPRTYGMCVLAGSHLDTLGTWTCYLTNDVLFSAEESFLVVGN